jgi:hypothetical protein
VDQAREFVVIKDVAHYTKAGELWKQVCAMMAEVDDGFDKNIKRWHEGHKGALADKARYWNPLNEVKKTIKIGMEKFDREQEAIRQAEQRRLEEIARKVEADRRATELAQLELERKAEEARLMEAAAIAEAAGDKESANDLAEAAVNVTEGAKQVAAAISSEPVYIPPVVLAKETPRVQGLSFRTIWKFRIVDPEKLPRKFLVPDEVKIGQIVRALKTQHGISGIEAYEERC